MSLTTRERGRGGYTRGEAYIRVGLFRVEKRVTNLGGLYSGELIHGKGGGGGGYLRNFTVYCKHIWRFA